jgi:7-cyano-7-deazaguanine tRNA-ribosyltransferase
MKQTETPLLFLSQIVNGSPKPWEYFKIDGLMVNAYEILHEERAKENIEEKGIHGHLGYSGSVAMDSGGFLFMRKKSLDISPRAILDLYESSEPDLGVVLDHPLEPGLSILERKKRQLKTLENTEFMMRSRTDQNPELVPVIHGYSSQTVGWYVRALSKIGDFKTYGIGSLVPSVFNAKGIGGIYNVLRIVSYVRKLLPEKKIHVFGVGSTLTMHLMFYAGADSVDSSGWRTKAAFGAIQLSGMGDRYITQRKRNKHYRDLSESDKKTLANCRCPVCREEGLERLRISFKARALHNSWIFQKEIEKTRRLVRREMYENYAEEVLSNSPFSRAFAFAKHMRNS